MHKILILLLLILANSSSQTFYDVNNIFGDEFNYYFKNFDLIFGEEGIEKEGLNIREAARYPLNITKGENINVSEFWYQLQTKLKGENRESGSVVVIVQLNELSSLELVLSKIRKMVSKQEISSQPYFLILSQSFLSQNQENELIANPNLTQGLGIESDVYFAFLRCSKAAKDCTKVEFCKISVPPKLCPSQNAELRVMEFYSVGDKEIIEPLVDLSLIQKVIRRTNLRNASLSTVAAFGYPFRAKFSVSNDSFESGYEADQIKFLGESFNLSISVGVGSGWISIQDDKLTGMGAQVSSGEVDISISASEVLPYRAERLQFLHPTYYTNMWGFFVQPPSSSFRDIFIHAFTSDLWLTMGSTWILIVMGMFALSVVLRRLNSLHENDEVLMQEIFIWAAGAICQQGWHICPESTSMKIVFIFSLITGLVCFVAYSAALVSILSLKVLPIKNLDDLRSRYTLYQDNQTINAMYVIQKLEAEGAIPCMTLEQRSIRSEVALGKILDPSTEAAFIGASDFFYPVAKSRMNDTAICNSISRVAIGGRPVRGGMFIKKGSPFKDFFNHRLLIMYERGIRFRLLENYFRQSAVMCLEKSSATKDPLGFNDVYTAFVILLLGYLLSLFILVAEIMAHNQGHRLILRSKSKQSQKGKQSDKRF